MRYRRAWIPGGSFFFTVVTQERRPMLASAAAVELLRQAFRRVRQKRPFTIDAIVVLPDHLHCIWTLPPGDADFATRWRLIKTWFTKHCDLSDYASLIRPTEESRDGCLSDYAAPIRPTTANGGIWQKRYWEHTLRNATDYERHIDYIHYNPVKHGLVSSVAEWPYSSFHRYVETGSYPPDWGGGAIGFGGVGQE